MIVLRINNLRESLRFKLSEWGCAVAMAGFGWILVQPYETFNNPSFVILQHWMSEQSWGVITLVIGLISLAVMIYNGRWKQFPKARVVLAGVRALIWGCITWGLLRNGMMSTGVAAYGAFLFMDMNAVYTASYDAKIIQQDQDARRTA